MAAARLRRDARPARRRRSLLPIRHLRRHGLPPMALRRHRRVRRRPCRVRRRRLGDRRRGRSTNGAVLVHDPAAVAWHDEPDWAERGRRHGGEEPGDPVAGPSHPRTGDPRPAPPPRARRHDRRASPVRPTSRNGQVVATVHSLIGAIADVAVHLPMDVPAAAAAHVAHDPRVHLGPPTTAALARARTVVDLHQPAIWDPAGLRAVLAAVRPEGPGEISIDHDGRRRATVSSTRALARVRRAAAHGIDPAVAMERLFGRARGEGVEAGLRPLVDDVDLAGLFARLVGPLTAVGGDRSRRPAPGGEETCNCS